MSSRRDSRVHISVRQNDALLEFENFKRKYLLVNKHITKLNSTLSVRVEELNAQISSLYVENLRLRASEVSLASQLKKEKERSHRLVDEAEAAVGILMKQLTGMRSSLSVRNTKPSTSSPVTKRKLPSSPVQPPRETTRLVRPPADIITQIRESDEDDADEDEDTTIRMVTSRRPSTSRLPLPKVVSPPAFVPPQDLLLPPPRPSAIPHINLSAGATKRKVSRRNSALLAAEHEPAERSPSPIVRPVRRSRRSSSEREDEEHEVETQVGVVPDVLPNSAQEVSKRVEEAESIRLAEARKVEERPRKQDRKGKAKDLHKDWEHDAEPHSTSERDSSEGARDKEKRRFGIKDVTNSPRKRTSEFTDEKPIEEPAASASSLATPSAAHTHLYDTLTPQPSASPLVSAASTPATDGGSEGGEGATGRERRTRKSVNYAEPKLNTKMRKPDPLPETASRPRASTGTVSRRRRSIPTSSPGFPSDEEGDADVEGSGSNTKWTEGRRKTVHNTTVDGPGDSNMSVIASGNPYEMWPGDGRRHSMAV